MVKQTIETPANWDISSINNMAVAKLDQCHGYYPGSVRRQVISNHDNYLQDCPQGRISTIRTESVLRNDRNYQYVLWQIKCTVIFVTFSNLILQPILSQRLIWRTHVARPFIKSNREHPCVISQWITEACVFQHKKYRVGWRQIPTGNNISWLYAPRKAYAKWSPHICHFGWNTYSLYNEYSYNGYRLEKSLKENAANCCIMLSEFFFKDHYPKSMILTF